MFFISLISVLLTYTHFLEASKPQIPKPKPVFKLGIENTHDAIWQRLKSTKDRSIAVALVTNHTSRDKLGRRSVDILLQRGIKIKKLLVPEHGFDGVAHAEKDVHDSIDEKTKIPIISLYGNGSGKKINSRIIKDVDAIIFDVQDSGMRHYTYISTLLTVLEAGSEFNKQIIVLDRPNPLGGCMEGPIVENSHSFISCAPIPLRHGMTMGELARYFNSFVLNKKAKLNIVPMENYKRSSGLNMQYTQLSPNLPTKESCYGYSMLGLLGEVRPCDIGIGTNHTMECITLPKSAGLTDAQWYELNTQLKKYGINTMHTTYYSSRKKEYCHGLKLLFPNINKTASFQALLTILSYFHKAQVPLKFSKYFDVAIGTHKVQEYIKGNLSIAQLQNHINAKLEQFNKQIQGLLLYQPAPKIVSL